MGEIKNRKLDTPYCRFLEGDLSPFFIVKKLDSPLNLTMLSLRVQMGFVKGFCKNN